MSAAFAVMNKCILKHNTAESIPPPFACQIQSSQISDLGPLISSWPSGLLWELQRWRELAVASIVPSSCRSALLTGAGMPDPETLCASHKDRPLTEPEVLQEMEDTVGLWPRQQSTGR